MKAIIVSDLHIGSRFFRAQRFESFLHSLPKGCDLILNGDVTDEIDESFDELHKRILELIRQESLRRQVVWVRGNVDQGLELPESGRIIFKRMHTIGDHILIIHGDTFDKIRPRMRFFIKLLNRVRRTWERLGGKPLSSAQFARKLEILYKVYRKTIMQNAVRHAKEQGFDVVVCGHTHFPEDRTLDGIRYINTGAWTEEESFYLLVENEEISLKIAEESTNP